MDDKVVGYIYIMVNPAYKENLIKIGYVSKNRLTSRAKELSCASGVPDNFYVYAIYGVHQKLADKKSFETIVKKLNPNIRYNSKREFYEMSPKDAYEMLQAIAEINGLEQNLQFNPLKDEYITKHYSTIGKSYTYTKDEIWNVKGSNAKCIIKNGKYILLSGAKIRAIGKSKAQRVARIREQFKDCVNDNLITIKDIEFDAPYKLTNFVLAYSTNGNNKLKNNEGITLGQFLKNNKTISSIT